MFPRQPLRLLTAGLVPVLLLMAPPPPTRAAGPEESVIVVLSDQRSVAAPGMAAHAAGMAARAAQQQPVLESLRRAGASRIGTLRLVNAVVATLPAGAAKKLEGQAGVKAVLPDVQVGLRVPPPVARTAPGPGRAGKACAGQDMEPITEPEGLALTNTLQAHKLANGAGVRVGVLGGAIDPAALEFVRDGEAVVAGYADFTGDGLDVPSFILESFGDASVIAAQGKGVYDAGVYAHPAHRPGAPCPIRILGVAPGATVHVAKVFSGVAAPTSVIMQGIEWAVLHERVDVLNESLVTYGYPDEAHNALRLANDAAAAAGVTVVVAAGDAGNDNTLGSPASDPDVIAVGVSTQMRAYAQIGYGGSPLGNGGFRSDSISALSSGGIAQSEPRTIDLVAPGDSSWAACSTDTARYVSCISFFDGGSPRPFFLFAGSSAAAPFVAGVSALVIQAFRRHAGRSPTPREVKQILTSSAHDLRQPVAQQGAGRVDSLAAVRLAAAVAGGPQANSSVLATASTQTLTGSPGRVKNVELRLTNPSSQTSPVSVAVRSTVPGPSIASGQVRLDGLAFTDVDGGAATGRRVPVSVPPGTDQLGTAVAWEPGAYPSPVAVSVFDPAGRLAAYSLPLGNGGFGSASVAQPAPGEWTIIIWTKNSAPPAEPVRYEVYTKQQTATTVAATVLSPRGSRTITVPVQLPSDPGDASVAVTVNQGGRVLATVPLGVRALVETGHHGGAFAGTFTGGNGALAGFALLGQYRSFQFDVPTGRPSLNVSVDAGDDPRVEIWGLLIAPDGMAMAVSSSRSSGTQAPPKLDLRRRDPRSGRWTVVLVLSAPSGNGRTATPFRGQIGFAPAPVAAVGIPAGAALPAGRPVTATLTVTNTGTAPASYFVDARIRTMDEIPLRAIGSATYPTPVSGMDAYPRFAVPTGTSRLKVVAESGVALALDTQPFGAGGFYVGDPDVPGVPGRRAVAIVDTAGGEISATTWVCNANQLGPFGAAPAPVAEVTCSATALTRRFDAGATSSTGNYWRTTEPFTPLSLAPGESGRITVAFLPSGRAGTQVIGSLGIASVDSTTGFGTEVATLPYAYTVS